MSLTKQECLRAYEVIDTLINLMCGEKREDGYEPSIDETINSMRVLKQLIEKHFENQPLKFEELKEGMWVWDNKYEIYIKIRRVNNKNSFIGYYPNFECNPETDEPYENLQGIFFFEENRFFRYEVKVDESCMLKY